MYIWTTSKLTYNLDFPLPKSKLTFRNLKKGAQELHGKFVLASADNATTSNIVVAVLKTRFINTQKQ